MTTPAVVGSIEPVDPADVMCISGYWVNLPRYHVDAIYRKNGNIYVDVSPAGREAFEPPDVTTYRMERVERHVNGEDVECLQFIEVSWHDATKTQEAEESPVQFIARTPAREGNQS